MSKNISDDFNKYGRLSSNAEFLSQIATLYPKNGTKPRDWSPEDIELLSSTMPVFGGHDEWLADDCTWTEEQVTSIRTNIAINHKLGIEYPQVKRDLLIAIQGDSLKEAFAKVMISPGGPEEFSLKKENFDGFIDTAFERCGFAINKDELKRFFKNNF